LKRKDYGKKEEIGDPLSFTSIKQTLSHLHTVMPVKYRTMPLSENVFGLKNME
jgi:hypothetical protein